MIKAGVIGVGRSGWELHAAPLSKLSDYEIVAVCDQSDSRAREAASTFGAKAYTNPEELIANDEVRLVVIAVPGHLHAPLAIAAMEAGKDVVVEKPMSATLAEADQMLAVAKRTGRTLAVFHNRHWDRDYQMVRSLVRKEVLGRLLTLDSRVMTYGPEWANYGVPEFNPQWRLKAAYGGGFLSDWGPHMVEQALDLAGEMPLTVTCEMRSLLWATEVEDCFHMRLSFPSGLLMTIEASNNARIPLPRWFVVASEGTMIADGVWGRWTDMRIRANVAGITMDMLPQDVGVTSGGRNMDVSEELSTQFYNDLAESLDSGREPAVPAQRGRDIVAILDAARQSSAAQETIRLVSGEERG